jgi:hypothetical protein
VLALMCFPYVYPIRFLLVMVCYTNYCKIYASNRQEGKEKPTIFENHHALLGT